MSCLFAFYPPKGCGPHSHGVICSGESLERSWLDLWQCTSHWQTGICIYIPVCRAACSMPAPWDRPCLCFCTSEADVPACHCQDHGRRVASGKAAYIKDCLFLWGITGSWLPGQRPHTPTRSYRRSFLRSSSQSLLLLQRGPVPAAARAAAASATCAQAQP